MPQLAPHSRDWQRPPTLRCKLDYAEALARAAAKPEAKKLAQEIAILLLPQVAPSARDRQRLKNLGVE